MEAILVDKIVDLLNSKYRCVAEIYSLTKKLKENLQQDDRNLVKATLSERAKQMDMVSSIDAEIEKLVVAGKAKNPMVFLRYLKSGIVTEVVEACFQTEESFEKIKEIVSRQKLVWENAVEIDKSISQRVIGKDSYYK